MALNMVGRWQRQSLLYAKETTWGTPVTASFYGLRESSISMPWSAKPIVAPAGPMGDGNPVPLSADFVQGKRSAAFQSTHPVTSKSWDDLFVLFFQGVGYFATPESYASPYTALGVSQWIVDVAKFATVVVKNDPDAADSSHFAATSCIINQLDLNMPQCSPGESGGLLELTASWIGQTSQRTTAYTTGTVTYDTAAPYTTAGVTFTMGTSSPLTAHMLSGNLSFKNGGSLNASTSADGLAPGATVGAIDVTGSVSCYFGQGALGAANGNPYEELVDALDANTYVYMKWAVGAASADMDISWPVIITGTPTFGETNGIITATFNFTGAWGASTSYLPKVHVPGGGIFEAWA